MELCPRIGVNKAWDEKIINEENVGIDFLPWSMVGT